MTIDHEGKTFRAEFEALKAKYGEAFADLTLVRFKLKKGSQIVARGEFVPYSCRLDDESGDIECVDEREM